MVALVKQSQGPGSIYSTTVGDKDLVKTVSSKMPLRISEAPLGMGMSGVLCLAVAGMQKGMDSLAVNCNR